MPPSQSTPYVFVPPNLQTPPNAMPTMPMQPQGPPQGPPPMVYPTLPSSQQGMAMSQHAAQAMMQVQSQPMPMPPPIPVQFPGVGAVLVSPRGTYALREVIGAGEFGAVYECVGPFDQIYAVKLVRPANRPYAEVHADWAKEVGRLLSLRHPNVVYIYDAFEQGNLFYLALERCDHALGAMLGTPMQEGLVLELTRQLLAAVQFLHDNDVVHDDLHPGNVLITHDTDRPVVKISDFGISHELRGAPAIRPNVVHHAIMAPEILQTGYTSKQSDLYQVGLLVYWMLVGRPAIDVGLPYADLVKQVGDGEPRRRAEAIGTPLGSLIAKMLRRREAYRYTSAREVWADLRGLPAWRTRALFPVR
jgi:serine/threonine-protein kinase